MRSRCKEPSRNKAETYLLYVEHLFRRSDNADARIFSKALEGKRLRVRIWREKQKRKCRDSIERPKSYD